MGEGVRIGRSAIHGRGVVALRAVARGAPLFHIEGKLVPWSRANPNGIQVWRDWYIEPRAGSPGRYVNHACAPNAEVTRALQVRARRRIAPGEEVTIDYASVVLWEPWRLHCACHAPACRGTLRAWGRTPARVRGRYPAPLFSFVERGIVPSGLPTLLADGARAAARRQRGS